MKKLLSLALLGLLVIPGAASAQSTIVVSDCSATGITYPAGGVGHNYAITTGGVLCSPSGAASTPVQGNVASAATDSGNPVKIGGVYNTTTPTFTNGQRGDIQIGSRGAAHVQLLAPDSGSAITANTPADGVANAGVALRTLSFNAQFNGSTWDRQVACTNTVAVSVTAAATTEIVPLTSAQVVRICSVALSMSAAGTLQFRYGTGTNCATGITNLSGVMTMATGTPLTIAEPVSGALRAPAGQAVCITAATGNVTGWVTYAKY